MYSKITCFLSRIVMQVSSSAISGSSSRASAWVFREGYRSWASQQLLHEGGSSYYTNAHSPLFQQYMFFYNPRNGLVVDFHS